MKKFFGNLNLRLWLLLSLGTILGNHTLLAQDLADNDIAMVEKELFGGRLDLGPEDEIRAERHVRFGRARVNRELATRIVNAFWGIEDRLDAVYERDIIENDADLLEILACLQAMRELLEIMQAQIVGTMPKPVAQAEYVNLKVNIENLGRGLVELDDIIAATEFTIETDNLEELLLNRDHWQAILDLWFELEGQLQPAGLILTE